MRGPIVAGTDGSETSLFALIEARSLARQSSLVVVVVFVRHVRFWGSASVLRSYALAMWSNSGKE